jgi:superfamily I DNA/RNA helicase
MDGPAPNATVPVLLLDERQDTRPDQHDLAIELGRSGRVRIFGDPMQAIYGFGGEALIDWDNSCRCRRSSDGPR